MTNKEIEKKLISCFGEKQTVVQILATDKNDCLQELFEFEVGEALTKSLRLKKYIKNWLDTSRKIGYKLEVNIN